MNRRVKVVIIVVVSVLVLASAGATAYYFFFKPANNDTANTQEPVDYREVNTSIAESGTTDADLNQLLINYGDQYEESVEAAQTTPPSEWTAETVDKAHLALLYADKMELYSQVQSLYYLIMSAKDEGIDVDANSAGVTQAERDEIKGRADAATIPDTAPETVVIPQEGPQ